jgi:non-ribosomal peptide synthetase component F
LPRLPLLTGGKCNNGGKTREEAAKWNKCGSSSYPAGVPAEIDVNQYETVSQVLEESMKKYAARTAFVCMGKSITYAQIDAASRSLGAWLQSRGIAPGGRVAMMMPNVMQYPVCVAAVLRAGYVVVNVNPLYTPRELEHQLKDSGAEAIIIIENFATTLEKIDRQHPRQARGGGGDGRPARRPQGHAGELRGAQGQEDGACLLAAGFLPLQRCVSQGAA